MEHLQPRLSGRNETRGTREAPCDPPPHSPRSERGITRPARPGNYWSYMRARAACGSPHSGLRHARGVLYAPATHSAQVRACCARLQLVFSNGCVAFPPWGSLLCHVCHSLSTVRPLCPHTVSCLPEMCAHGNLSVWCLHGLLTERVGGIAEWPRVDSWFLWLLSCVPWHELPASLSAKLGCFWFGHYRGAAVV